MPPAIVSGMVTGDAAVMISYWPIFSLPKSQFQKFLLFCSFPPETPSHTQAMVNQQFKTIDYHWIVMGTMLPLRRILKRISHQHRQIVQLPLYQHI